MPYRACVFQHRSDYPHVHSKQITLSDISALQFVNCKNILLSLNQLKEKCREYNIPLCVALVDYEKAFDSVQTQAILTSLLEQGIEDVYIEILKDIYTDSSVTVHLHKESE